MTDARWAELAGKLRRFVAEREWGQFHDPKNLSMLIASEAGELLALFRWVDNREADHFATDAENRVKVLHELADVTIGVLLLADRLGVDLVDVVAEKMERNAEKYPADSSRGRSS